MGVVLYRPDRVRALLINVRKCRTWTRLTGAGLSDERYGLQTVSEDVRLGLVQLNVQRSVDRLLS